MGNKPGILEDLADATVRNEVPKKDKITLVTREQTSCKARGNENQKSSRKIWKQQRNYCIHFCEDLEEKSGILRLEVRVGGKVSRKGNITNYNNLRGITLLLVPSRVLIIVI